MLKYKNLYWVQIPFKYFADSSDTYPCGNQFNNEDKIENVKCWKANFRSGRWGCSLLCQQIQTTHIKRPPQFSYSNIRGLEYFVNGRQKIMQQKQLKFKKIKLGHPSR